MKRLVIISAILLIALNHAFAQYVRFVTSGSIEYEKSVNTYALIKKMYGNDMDGFDKEIFEQYKKTQPQFRVTKSTLTFTGNKTLFVPDAVEAANNFFYLPLMGQPNTIFCDWNTYATTIQKKVFEQTFLLKDTIRHIKWKITDETREIAGYTCRRANGLVMDSVYVVAFYAEKIPISGGPESFSGLPGMILQVALPHDNVSWLATKVTEGSVSDGSVAPPAKGKPVSDTQLSTTLQSIFKNWGDTTRRKMMMKEYLL
jgi:GLPGLI family protein